MSVINWQNDPLLYDLEPQPVNQWVNANELIQQNRRNEIFLPDKQQLDLYPIMVRKNDFVRRKASDRIMARFPFLVLEEEKQEQIVNKILLISEVTRDYFYKSINKSILQWKQDILKYLTRGTLPFPIARCCFEFVPNLHAPINETSLCFTSARGEPFKMPRKLTKELAYLAGMVNGDGNLQKYTLRIVDYSIKNIKQLQVMFQEYFDQTGNILYKTPNAPEVVITNLWVVRLFSFLTNQPIGIRKYNHLREPLIFKQEPFRSYYWSGVMDADGSYTNGNVSLVSASRDYVKDFQNYLLFNKIKATFRERNDGTNIVYIPSPFRDKLKQILTCLHPEKNKDFQKLKKSKSNLPLTFIDFNHNNIIDKYFNLRLINGLYVIGLNKYLQKSRGEQSYRKFASILGTSHKTLIDSEMLDKGISVGLLEKVILYNNEQLLPFLDENKENIRFNLRNTKQVKLIIKPNEELVTIIKQLQFYKTFIRIQENSNFVRKKFEKLFNYDIQDNHIKDPLLLRYFTTFSILEDF